MKFDGINIFLIPKLFQFVTLDIITYVRLGADALQMSMSTFVMIIAS